MPSEASHSGDRDCPGGESRRIHGKLNGFGAAVINVGELLPMDESLLEQLREIAEARLLGADPAHDFSHVTRVTTMARRIALFERACLEIVIPAALLHELFNHPKGHPQSHLSGEICARHAERALRDVGYPDHWIDPICDCIATHPFSGGAQPTTLEGKILQDADRLDAIGAIGIARLFATSALMSTPFYSDVDAFCQARAPDDKRFAIDHFFRKLLRIPDGLHTETARAMAGDRVSIMNQFLEQLGREIKPGGPQ